MTKRILLLILSCFLTGSTLFAQTGRVSGTISDEQDRIPGATILILDSGIGAASDENGEFSIPDIPAGNVRIKFSSVGYESVTKTIRISEGKTTRVDVVLRPKTLQTGEVLIIGSRAQEQNDPRTSLIELQPRSAKVMAGATEDVFRTLQAMPGVLAPNDFSSQLIVRGSGPDQNLIIIDDIEIFNPYRLYGVISMFNPSAVSEINLMTGGFPAKYGDRLSATLDVTNKEGVLNAPFKGSVNASISDANVVFEGKNPFDINGSWLVNSRRTYYDLIVSPFVKKAGLVDENVTFPNFYDVQAKLVFGPFRGHKFSFLSIFSADGVDVVSAKERKTADSVSVSNLTHNNVVGFSWLFTKSTKLFNKFNVSYYMNTGDADFASATLDPSLKRDAFKDISADTIAPYLLGVRFKTAFTFEKISIADRFTYFWKNNVFEAGAGVDFLKTIIDFKFEIDPQLRSFFSANPNARSAISDLKDIKRYRRFHLYAQNTFTVTPNLFLEGGLRADYYDLLEEPYVSPRAALSYALNDLTTIRLGFGVYYQSPGYEKLRDQNVLYDLSRENSLRIDAEKAVHYIFSIERWLDSEWNLKTELYYKDFRDLLIAQRALGTAFYSELIPGRDPRFASSYTRPVILPADSITQIPGNASKGEGYGIEFLLAKKNVLADTKLSGWISYALAWADRIEAGKKIPFRFDQRHTLNIVLNYTINPAWQIGMRWQYGSGFPYTEPVGIRPRIVPADYNLDGKIDGYEIATRRTLTNPFSDDALFDIAYGDQNRFNARKPDYHRLDVRGTYFTKFWGLNWTFYLDVINIYNHTNVVGYDYYITENLELGREINAMFPILPTLGFSINF